MLVQFYMRALFLNLFFLLLWLLFTDHFHIIFFYKMFLCVNARTKKFIRLLLSKLRLGSVVTFSLKSQKAGGLKA